MTVYHQTEKIEGVRASRDEVPDETVDVEFVLLPPEEHHVWDADRYHSVSILEPDMGVADALPEFLQKEAQYWNCLATYVPDADTFVTAIEATVHCFSRFRDPPFERHPDFDDHGEMWWYTAANAGHYNYLHRSYFRQCSASPGSSCRREPFLWPPGRGKLPLLCVA